MKTENYIPTIGLEIHAELKTETKMFCNSRNAPFEAEPNTHICPVCLGYPGTLPVINKEAVRQVLRVGVALEGKLADYTEFDRKNYFYQDISKGYQISQYKHPLVEGGELAGVKVTRVHLEEDTGKSIHNSQFAISNGNSLKNENSKTENSLLDYNRAGVPLMELVTEPVIHDAETASKFAKELQLLLISLGASEANMERGEMRVEANISISKDDTFGTKVEVKNLNSFRSVERAVRYELERQEEILERGESVAQETRGWDESKEVTFSQRAKEGSHDYRYFPDPDLPKLMISEIPEFDKSELAASLPELPWNKRTRLIGLGLAPDHAEVYVSDKERGDYFEAVTSKLEDHKLYPLASNFILTDLKTLIVPEELAEVVKMFSAGELSSRGAKDILKIISTDGGSARKIAQEKNIMQISDEKELRSIAEKVMSENKGTADFLVGQAMKASGGRANPQVLKKIFSEVSSS